MQKASATNINNLGLSTANTNHLSTKSAINSSQTSPTQIILSNNSSSLSPVNNGIYKKMTVATYSRPNKPTMVNTGSIAVPNCPVRVSFVTIPSRSNLFDENQPNSQRPSDIICYNVGRELFVFDYVSIQGTPNLNSPIDKRIYKGTFPTCHDFNQETARSDVCSLIIGFSAGQIQLIDPLRKDFVPSKLFNEERNIDKTPVTCVKWIPGQPTNFMVSHQSGNIYLYNEAFFCFVDNPVYQIFKQLN
uniref:Uncharacterized protein n=1 Tax=Panagrolaimus sp. PS1159 TaxID=55785 RepID=A0AC35G338_9BILA